jgi:hypothetical protein
VCGVTLWTQFSLSHTQGPVSIRPLFSHYDDYEEEEEEEAEGEEKRTRGDDIGG